MASFENAKQAALSKWLNERADVPAENAPFGSRTPRLWPLKGDVAGLGWYDTEKRRPAVFSNLAALGPYT